MALQGFSFYKIALELNNNSIRTKSGSMWHPLTIKRIVTNQTYTGKTYFGKTKRISNTKVTSTPQEDWILLPDITPPIISEEMFKRTQEVLLEAKQSRPIKQNSPYLLTGFMKCSKCGSPIGGTTLSGKYRYYQCRGTRPTTTRSKICNAGYIKAGDLEKSVWNKVLELLLSPLTLLSLLKEVGDNERKQSNKGELLSILEKQINQVRRKLKAYPAKERNLYALLPHEAVTKDYVLDVVNQLKKERLNDERQLNELLATRKEATRATHITVKLSELSKSLRAKALHSQQESLDGKRNLLDTLQLNVVADPQSYQFHFQLGAQIISTTDSDTDAIYTQQLEEFERKHPETSIVDLLSGNKPLPDDTPYARAFNQIQKNLVTIEQTSA